MNNINKKACCVFLSTIFFVLYMSCIIAANQYGGNYPTIILYGGNITTYHELPPINNQNGFTWKVVESNSRNKSNFAANYVYDNKVVQEDKKRKTQNALAEAAKRAKQLKEEEERRAKKEQKRRETKEKKLKKTQEDARIKQQQSAPRLRFKNSRDLDPFIKNCEKQVRSTCASGNNDLNARLTARINAIDQVLKKSNKCFDYSSQVKHPTFTDPYARVFDHCYGTELDKQLHKELCDTRITMMGLQSNYADNLQVMAFAPLIYQATAQAKKEQNVEKAFSLSDFSYDLVRIVTGGVRLMVLAVNDPSIAARGIAGGVKTACNPQHWLDMGMGLLKTFVLLTDEDGRQDSLANSCLASAVLGRQDSFLKECDNYVQHSQAQKKAIQQEFYETAEKLKNMSDEELIENIFSFGTTFFLDGVILKVGTLAATIEGRALLGQCAEALNSPFAKEYVLEAAGVGKIALEDGAETADRIVNIVANNPELVADYNASVFNSSKVTWAHENIPNGAIYKELAGIAPEVMPAQNLKHYFLGEIIKKRGELRLQGFHHARSYPERIKEIIVPRDTHGCYYAKYVYEGLEKKSSFFPDHWNRVTVLKKISEAYKNPTKFKDYGIVGVTSEGIEIEMWFIKDKTGNLKINSAYPIVQGMR